MDNQNTLNFKPSPGIVVLTGVEDKNNSLTLTNKSQGRIIKGKIVAIGDDDKNTYGTPFKASDYGKIGNIAWFLHYSDEGGVDIAIINGKKYYFVKFADIRGTENE